MSPYTLHRIPGEDLPDTALIICGIGSRGAPPSILTKRIAEQGMAPYYMERHGDERLAGGPGAIAEYTEAISAHVSSLAATGRDVNVVTTSFGAWLTLLALLTMDDWFAPHSLALLAPLINAGKALDRIAQKGQDGLHRMKRPMDKENRDPVVIRAENLNDAPIIGPGHLIKVPTVAIIGSKDEVESPENLSHLTWPDVALHIIEGVDHRGIITHRDTRALLAEFYARVRRVA